MDIVINLLLFYSKMLVALLLFQQVSNQPIKPLWCIIGPFLYTPQRRGCSTGSGSESPYSVQRVASYVLLLGTLLSFLSLLLITYIKISMVVKHLIFFMACTPLSLKAC